MDTINDRIYSLRIQAGISQQRLADDLNLSRRAISLHCAGVLFAYRALSS